MIEIIPNKGSYKLEYWPTIKVQWYYKKKDVDLVKNNLNEKKLSSISEYEVFKTNHYDVIFIETIIGKCLILTFEEYESQIEVNNNVFYSRYGYDPTKNLLLPRFEKWEKHCKCILPLNPDQLYIRCDICSKWFHPECCGIKESEIEEVEFICYLCKSN